MPWPTSLRGKRAGRFRVTAPDPGALCRLRDFCFPAPRRRRPSSCRTGGQKGFMRVHHVATEMRVPQDDPDKLLTVKALTCGYGGTPVIRDVSFSLSRGNFVGVTGPNGCGKSTLLRALTGILKASSGSVALNGRDVSQFSRREVARQIAVIPQDTVLLFEFSVLEMVLMGRTPHLKRFQRAARRDHDLALEALRQTDLLQLRDHKVTELSGGERQRVVIARALAQEPALLLLDEPDSHLDIGHQIEIFELLKHLNATRGLTLLCVTHDLNLASAYCERLMLMSSGCLVATGPPNDIITPERIQNVYGVKAVVERNPINGLPQITAFSADDAALKPSV